MSTIQNVSTNQFGDPAYGFSFAPVISPDGSKVAFFSTAENLVAVDGNNLTDVFIKDLASGSVMKVTNGVDVPGLMGLNPTLSFAPDGSKLVFSDGNGAVFVSDVASGVTSLTPFNGGSYPPFPVFLQDANTLAFSSGSMLMVATLSSGVANPIAGCSPGARPSFAAGKLAFEDASGGVTVLAGGATLSFFAGAGIWRPALSADGSTLAFNTNAALLPEDLNGEYDVYVLNLNNGQLVRASTTASGQEVHGGPSVLPVLSADGSKVFFESAATDLVPGDVNGKTDFFMKDLPTGTVTRINTSFDGSPIQGDTGITGFMSISADGSKLVFASMADNLTAVDFNSARDVFVVTLDGGSGGSGGTVTSTGYSYSLAPSEQDLILSGPGAFNGYGNALNNSILGNSNNNVLDGGGGNDVLEGGTGNDTLAGGEGIDTYRFSQGDGADTVLDDFYGGVFKFTNVASTGISGLEGLADSKVRINYGPGDSITVDTDFIESYGTSLEFSNGVTLTSADLMASWGPIHFTGSSANEYFWGTDFADVIRGGAGNDYFNGLSGNDTYEFYAGDGIDQLFDNYDNGTVMHFKDVLAVDFVGLQTLSGGDLRLRYTAADAVDVQWFNAGMSLKFADGEVWSSAELVSRFGPFVFNGTSGNDYIDTTLLDDVIYGGAGNDSLDGLGGSDILYGGDGDDTLYGCGQGFVYGVDGNDRLDGGLGADKFQGSYGDDTYVVDNAGDNITYEYPYAEYGIDTVESSISWTLGANLEKLMLTGSANLNGTGNTLNNTLTGNSGNNVLDGGDGNDLLDGGLGNDTLIGGLGDDTYVLNVATDVITEAAAAGTDTVQAAFTYTLGATLENLTLSGALAINGYGNSANNILTGNSAGNTLKGNGGTDTLTGGAGDDRYYVDGLDDTVTELAAEGDDYVYSSSSYTLSLNLERLYLQEGYAAALNATGNSGDNTLTGNTLNNILTGNGGKDTLVGRAGDDRYYVDSGDDVIAEKTGEGLDEVFSTSTYTLSNYVENLTLTGTLGINGYGNSANNILTGNSTGNTLKGNGGTDTLIGGGGDDRYYVDSTGDIVTELAGEGTDYVYSTVSYTLSANLERLYLQEGFATALEGTGNSGANTLTGNSLNNILRGNGGTDTLIGRAGDDKFYVDSADDVVAENAGEGTDEVISTVNYTLGSNVENLSLGGTALTATGNSLANVIKGNSSHNTLSGGSGNDSLDGKAGNDVLDGGLGADTLLGGLSSDTYVVDNAGDVVTELLNEGTDVVQASISYALGANVEQLQLTGAAALNGTGNELANVLTGNSGANVLTGGLGGDTYAAARGMGADTLVDADATAGVLDILSFATGVAYDQLWFVHSGNHLEVSIIGTGDKAVVQDWYSGASNQIERIKTVDGVKTLVSMKVESLVTAMAGLTPPPLGQMTLTLAQHAALDGVIAASWS